MKVRLVGHTHRRPVNCWKNVLGLMHSPDAAVPRVDLIIFFTIETKLTSASELPILYGCSIERSQPCTECARLRRLQPAMLHSQSQSRCHGGSCLLCRSILSEQHAEEDSYPPPPHLLRLPRLETIQTESVGGSKKTAMPHAYRMTSLDWLISCAAALN